jgi:hypothetical protein
LFSYVDVGFTCSFGKFCPALQKKCRKGEIEQSPWHARSNEKWQKWYFFELSQRIHGSSFVVPRYIHSAIAGPEGAKNLAGGNVLRLIQIRLNDVESQINQKPRQLVKLKIYQYRKKSYRFVSLWRSPR